MRRTLWNQSPRAMRDHYTQPRSRASRTAACRFSAPELRGRRRQVVPYGPLRQRGPLRDLRDGRPVRRQFQHLRLPGGQRRVPGADRVRGQLRVHVTVSGVHGPDDLRQPLRRHGLRHEAPHPRRQRPLQMPGPPVAGHDHRPAAGQLGPQRCGHRSHRPPPASGDRAPPRRAGAPAPSPAPRARTPPRRRPADRPPATSSAASAPRIRCSSSASSTRIARSRSPRAHPPATSPATATAARSRRRPGPVTAGLPASPPPAAELGRQPEGAVGTRLRGQRVPPSGAAVPAVPARPLPGSPAPPRPARRRPVVLHRQRAPRRPRRSAQPDRAAPRVRVPQHVRGALPHHPAERRLHRRAAAARRPRPRSRQSIPAARQHARAPRPVRACRSASR